MLRWISREEFEAGERVNPYPHDVPASLRDLRAVRERRLPWLLAPGPGLIAPVVRRLLAARGRVWLPDAVLSARGNRRLVLGGVVLFDVCAAVLFLGGSSVALLLFLLLTLVVLPIAVRAVRQVRVAAFIDTRTGLVGVEDGVSRM